MTALARLSFWVPPERQAKFAEFYSKRLVPLLNNRGLKETHEHSRQTVDGVFSRFFELDTPASILTQEELLRNDPAWHDALRCLQSSSDTSESESDGLRHEFGICHASAGTGTTTKAGQGQTVRVGAGFRQGLWQCFTAVDGLASGRISGILQDQEGDLWLSTVYGGVCRYDGAQFVTFTTRDGLVSNIVGSMLEDRQGNLWFGTLESGVCRYDGKHFTNFTIEDGLAHDFVWSILEDSEGHYWFGTNGGVSRYDGTCFVTFREEDGLGSNRVRSTWEDREGNLWIATEGGVSRYDRTQFVTYTTHDGLAHNHVKSILEDRQGNLWFGTRGGGVSRFDGTQFLTFDTDDGLVSDYVSSVMEDRQGRKWIGTIGGLSRYDGTQFVTFTTHDGLVDNDVQFVFEDRYDNIWTGTRAGIGRYDGQHIEVFTAQDGLAEGALDSLLEDRHGDLWIGTLGGGLSRYDGTQFVSFTTKDGLAGNWIWAIGEDREGNLWIGTEGGVSRYDGTRFATLTTDLPTGYKVRSILEDRQGNLWLGTDTFEGTSGLNCYDGKQFTGFTTQDGLVDNHVQCLAEDQRGYLWVGTRVGLSRYDGTQFASFTTDDGLANNHVISILADRHGNMWFGTNGDGVSRFDGSECVTLTTRDGLVDNHVASLAEDRQGNIWIGTYGGVSRFDGLVFQTLARKDGLLQDHVGQILEDTHGNIWMASDSGLTRYRPSHIAPAVHVEVIADRRYRAEEEIAIPSTQKLVSVEFRGSSFVTRPEGIAYVYQLAGYDSERQFSDTGRAEYHDLPVGKYTLQVQAVDRDFNYSDPASVKIRVVPDPKLEGFAQALSVGGPAGEFVGQSSALRHVLRQLAQVSRTDVTVLILGETGTGKGLAARSLHRLGANAGGPFIQVNCGGLPEGLIESELFGHEKGAFTGAHARKLGKVELAAGGTLFLDEIGDLTLDAQAKLLRLLEEQTFERVGGSETLEARTRVVAATNRDLREMVGDGSFREDLYYRLQVFPVRLPPLRERREDIALLASYFMVKMAAHLNKQVIDLGPEALALLQSYDWPGNVRELEHAVQRGVIVGSGSTLRAGDFSLTPPAADGLADTHLSTLEENERRYILEILEKTGWVIGGPHGAAAILGLKDSTLRSRMKNLSITRPSPRDIA